MTTNLADRVEAHAAKAERAPAAKATARVGLAARGVIYCVVAAITVQVALGEGGRVDRQGALKTVADEPLGKALLVLLAVGFAAYALWRFLKAASGAGEGSARKTGATGAVKRVGDVGRGILYLGVLYSTVRLLSTDRVGAGSDEEAKSWSARLMQHEAGRWLVIAAGVVIVIVGIALVVRAFARKFEKHLELGEMSPWQREWLPRLGIVGYAARGLVAAAVGVFLVQAGVTFRPDKAVGIDGALKRLAEEPYGPVVLLFVAAGLLAFGLYSFVEARFRRVLEG